MNPEKPLSIIDITNELNSGLATIKFILNRFSPWLPFERIEGQPYYSRDIIPVLIKINASLEAGLLPSEIDQELKTTTKPETSPDTRLENHFLEQPNEDIRVSKDGLTLIKSLFDDIAIQQSRVATAHEKRAVAEERKAIAIEKRAEAEEKKAMAMNNIAMALQEMNQHRLPDSQTKQVAIQAAQILTDDEANPNMGLPELNNTEQQDYSEIFDSQDPPVDLFESSEIDMDDLTDLIKDDTLLDDPLDDLSTLIDQAPPGDNKNKEVAELDDLSTLLDDPTPHPNEIDDLWGLIEEASPSPENAGIQMDDLSLLIDETTSQPAESQSAELDNLSLLIDETTSQPEELDNLSLLIDETTSQPEELDNLSLLIDETTSQPEELDNLSLLITPDSIDPVSQAAISQPPMDDLSALIEKAPSLKPDITPEENLKEYKAAVMKTILQLKTDGVSAIEATRRLNEDGVQTISGKPQWSEVAISQIYKFIDSAK